MTEEQQQKLAEHLCSIFCQQAQMLGATYGATWDIVISALVGTIASITGNICDREEAARAGVLEALPAALRESMKKGFEAIDKRERGEVDLMNVQPKGSA